MNAPITSTGGRSSSSLIQRLRNNSNATNTSKSAIDDANNDGDDNHGYHHRHNKKMMSSRKQKSKERQKSTLLLRIRLLLLLATAYRILVFWRSFPDEHQDGLAKLRASTRRQTRFPSVEERIKSYMGDWYLPPCSKNGTSRIQYDHHVKPTESESDKAQWKKMVQMSVPYDNTKNDSQTPPLSSIITASNRIDSDVLLFMDPIVFEFCANFNFLKNLIPWLRNNEFVRRPMNMKGYCLDVQEFLLDNNHHHHQILSKESTLSTTPLLFTFGDSYYKTLSVPHFRKTRPATSIKELERVTGGRSCYDETFRERPKIQFNQTITTDPSVSEDTKESFLGIILKLNAPRHFGSIKYVKWWDIPWSQKKDMAVFRGVMSGHNDLSLLQTVTVQDESNNNNIIIIKQDDPATKECLSIQRCHFVLNVRHSKLINAKLVDTLERIPNTILALGNNNNNKNELVDLVGWEIWMWGQLEYKAIIMIEGNDVASGLKWALYSRSVVMMPEPTVTSWALEEMLEPWKVRTSI